MRIDKIKITPLADESLGVRSMCLFIDLGELRILLDAGVSLAPRRYGLPPHLEEFKALKKAREKILLYAKKSDVITVSHYHRDHYTPTYKSWYEWCDKEIFTRIYGNKIVLVKDGEKNINFNQRKRAYIFLKELNNVADKVIVADSKEICFGSIRIKTRLFPHGYEGTKLGYVLSFLIEADEEKILYMPDVQGPVDKNAMLFIKETKPDILIIGGPPTYLEGRKLSKNVIKLGLENISKLKHLSGTLIIGHHLLRDKRWISILEEYGLKKREYLTYSDILGIEFTGLESMRDILYQVDPPPPAFKAWIEKIREGVKNEPPPL